MPVEIIGEGDTLRAERESIAVECELAIKQLKKVCGEPPEEMDLGCIHLTLQAWRRGPGCRGISRA